MRIIHVVRQFFPAVGGLENVVEALAAAQVAQGHQVGVVTLDRLFKTAAPRRLPPREIRNGIAIERIPFFGSHRYPVALTFLSKIKDADIVHVHGIDFFVDYLAWTKAIHKKTLVLSTHGGFFHTSFAQRVKQLYFGTMTRLSLTCFAGVAAVSASDFKRFSPVRGHGMVCIENGVEIAKYRDASSPTPQKRMMFLGRLAQNKRLDRLLEFLCTLRQLDPGWTLVIAGRPWDVSVEDLEALAARLGIAAAIEVVPAPS